MQETRFLENVPWRGWSKGARFARLVTCGSLRGYRLQGRKIFLGDPQSTSELAVNGLRVEGYRGIYEIPPHPLL